MKAKVTYRLPNELVLHFIEGSLVEGLVPGSFVLSEFNGLKQWSIIDEADSTQKLQLPMLPKNFTANRSEYESRLNELIARIKSTAELEKVVYSRCLQVPRKLKSVRSMFDELASMRRDAFVYLLESEQHGVWLGASPEVLIQGEGKYYKTYSLAGTRPSIDSNWSEKEMREQAIVTEYITRILLSFDPSMKKEPVEERLAGNVKHLLTQMEFRLEPGQLGEAIHELHPTPAVCGLPKKNAFEIIEDLEAYDRGLYAGFLGPYQLGGKTSLFVNLRCAQMDQEQILIYVGGGITEDSDASSEWEETELKSQSIRDLLN